MDESIDDVNQPKPSTDELRTSIVGGETLPTGTPPYDEEVYSNSPIQNAFFERRDVKKQVDLLQKELTYRLTTKAGWWNSLITIFPIFDWLPNYNLRNNLVGDIIAGLTVGAMLVPQSMGYATTAGLPPVYGLYSALLPIYIYATMGTSRQLSVGPVAVLSLLVSSSISALVPTTDVADYVRLCTALALMSGLINTFLGVFRLGFIVAILSPAVITGFTSASSIILFCNQLASIFGVKYPTTVYSYTNVYRICQYFPSTLWLPFTMATICIISVSLLQKWKPLLPWSFMMIVITTIISYLVNIYTDIPLPIVGIVPQGLPPFTRVLVSDSEIVSLIPTAFIASFVGFAESISIAKKYAQEDRYQLNPSQEFLALGVANVIGSYFGSYTVTGSFSRTAVKYNTGSKTQISAIIAGTIVLFALLFLTPLFTYIPKCALASVVCVAVVKLFDVERFVHYFKTSLFDFAIAVVTFICVLAFDVDIGIACGIGFSLLVIIYQASRPKTAELGNIGGKLAPNYRNIKRNKDYKLEPHMVVARIDAPVYFSSTDFILQKLNKYLQNSKSAQPIKYYIIECGSVSEIDYAGAEMLRNFAFNLRKKRITLLLTDIPGQVAETLVRANITEEFGPHNFFFTVAEAVEEARRQIKLKEGKPEEFEVEEEKQKPLKIEIWFQGLFNRARGRPQSNSENPVSPSGENLAI